MTDAPLELSQSNRGFSYPNTPAPLQRHRGVCDPTYSGTEGCRIADSIPIEILLNPYSGTTVPNRGCRQPSRASTRAGPRDTAALRGTATTRRHRTTAATGIRTAALWGHRWECTPEPRRRRSRDGARPLQRNRGNLYDGTAGVYTAEPRGFTETIQRHRGVCFTALKGASPPIPHYTAAIGSRTVKSRLCDVRDS